MTKDELLARAKREVEAAFKPRLGRLAWWTMNYSEKHNYAVAWAAGYLTGQDERPAPRSGEKEGA